MSADIAGYSRMMGHDEEGTHVRMTRYRRDIVEPTVAEHSGTIVKHMGDGFLAVFDSPLEATRCAIVIQQTIAARNAAVSDKTHWLQYRIGINLGDIIYESNDIFGDGVNIAARLQTAAKPGDVNISGGVYEQVKNKLVCGYQSLGDERLKNITDPVRIYRVLPDPSAVVNTDHGVRWVARTAVPIVGACALTFGIGVWYATQRLADKQAIPDVAARGGEQPIPKPTQEMPAPVSVEAKVEAKSSEPQTAIPHSALVAPPPQAPISEPSPVAVLAPPMPAQRPEPATPSDAFRDCPNCPDMISLTGGMFRMGSSSDLSEKPVHQVNVAPFALSRVPVTKAQWQTCVAAKECTYHPDGADDLPVRNVSWKDAQQYIAWLSKTTSKPYRLPNEAEWEYAARAGTTTAYWWGARMAPGYANCRGCGTPHDPEKPIQIGLLPPNPFGLQGMGGGVAEWVSDCWHSSYQGAPRTGSWSAPNCREHVLRGGSWLSELDDVRVSSREAYDSDVRYPSHGFRVALSSR
ncbi:SUMF1/EgtB/PvdO family nonheme iron enzyme [Methylobacterium sp. J-070]|uniref:SUMF1/EgtB/PvdO family nonheme iron enzyme n=1 Tax=Methylobacterium sp. J-070 TaxID=2836650 RepID=UPI001FB8F422|nr:SUMF1/EgtB/PvdO family nonheme iron enzyme [Methylobacterium sp. J-070]MCJ2051727.1 SUMF1/EgtB/PvdO family nonheme iron enzyme [Methylobacterium sp. J-070]